MGERVDWLRGAMAGTWTELGDELPRLPRRRSSAFIAALATDTVVVSHFVAINAVIGACLGDDRVVIRRLDNASVTVVDVAARPVRARRAGGHEADTLIR